MKKKETSETRYPFARIHFIVIITIIFGPASLSACKCWCLLHFPAYLHVLQNKKRFTQSDTLYHTLCDMDDSIVLFYSFIISSLSVYCRKIHVQKSKRNPTMHINYSLAMCVELKWATFRFVCLFSSFATSNKTNWHAHHKNNGKNSSKIEPCALNAVVSNGWSSLFIPLLKPSIEHLCIRLAAPIGLRFDSFSL